MRSAAVICTSVLIGTLLIAHGAEAPTAAYDRQAVAIEVDSALTIASASGKGALVRLLEGILSRTSEAPLPGETRAALNGEVLPSFFFRPRFPGRDIEDVRSGAQFGSTAKDYRVSRLLIGLIPALIDAKAQELAGSLAIRSRHVPPSAIDIIVSIALNSASLDRAGDQFWKATANDWRKMLKGKNPVYRLIALNHLSRFENDGKRALKACRDALQEKNTIFQFTALQELERIGGPSAIKIIDEFIKKNPPKDDGTLGFDLDVVACAKDTRSKLKIGDTRKN